MSSVKCPICSEVAYVALQLSVRGKSNEPLFRCSNCAFHCFAQPNWLQQSFTDNLHQLDLGSVSRCLLVADFVTAVLPLRRRDTRVLDWGGGDGLLTRVLRDRGIDCVWYDPFTKPTFVGDSLYEPQSQVDVTVASEVFLHLTDPVAALKSLLSHSEVVVVTAVVPPKKLDSDWWYLMPETGQHVAFYPISALKELADQTDTYLNTDRRFFHVFSKRRLSLATRLLIGVRPLAFGVAYFQIGRKMVRTARGRSESLTPLDQARLIDKNRSELRNPTYK